jgi:hypothetical protein
MGSMVKLFSELGGTTRPLMRYPDSADTDWSAFNPSIGWAENLGYGMLIRSSNYLLSEKTGAVRLNVGREIMTRTWFAELNEDLSVRDLREVEFDHGDLSIVRGVEDARLFERNGSWAFTAVMLEREHTRHARLAEYTFDGQIARYLGKLETPTPNTPEKNWMAPDVPTSAFDYVYSIRQIYKDHVLRDIANPPAISGIRGSSGLVRQPDQTYLAIVHRCLITKTPHFNQKMFRMEEWVDRDYRHMVARYSADGKLLELSPEFFFEGRGVEYAAGLVEHENNFVISYGKRDVSAHIAVIPKSVAESLLEPVVDIIAS